MRPAKRIWSPKSSSWPCSSCSSGRDHCSTSASSSTSRRCKVIDHSDVQRDRNLRQLRRRLVRHSDQYVCQLAGRRLPACEASRFPCYDIPLQAGMSIGMLLICVELVIMLCILLFVPRRLCRALLHRLRHRRIAGRGGASHRGRHLHQNRRYRRRSDEDRLQDQRRRRPQPGRDRRLHGR